MSLFHRPTTLGTDCPGGSRSSSRGTGDLLLHLHMLLHLSLHLPILLHLLLNLHLLLHLHLHLLLRSCIPALLHSFTCTCTPNHTVTGLRPVAGPFLDPEDEVCPHLATWKSLLDDANWHTVTMLVARGAGELDYVPGTVHTRLRNWIHIFVARVGPRRDGGRLLGPNGVIWTVQIYET